MILYFSSTGNSKLLAENLALFTNDTAYNLVDFTTTHTEKILRHTPRLGFVFPTYGWDMPVIVSSFFIYYLLYRKRDSNPHEIAFETTLSANCMHSGNFVDRVGFEPTKVWF